MSVEIGTFIVSIGILVVNIVFYAKKVESWREGMIDFMKTFLFNFI